MRASLLLRHMDVPSGQAREPLKTTLFKGEIQAGQEALSCSDSD
jgi:hypothetical protein